MDEALAEAEAAAARGEVPVGAVLLAPAGTVLARDGNRGLEHSDPTAHAEILVLRTAAGRLGTPRPPGWALHRPRPGAAPPPRLRPLRHPRALPDVPRRDQPGGGRAALLRGVGPEGRGSRERPAPLREPGVPPPAGGVRGHRGEEGRGSAAGVLQGAAVGRPHCAFKASIAPAMNEQQSSAAPRKIRSESLAY